MALTNAQHQANARQRRSAKLARYERALREIVATYDRNTFSDDDYSHGVDAGLDTAARIARDALQEVGK